MPKKDKSVSAEDHPIGALVRWSARPTLKNRFGTSVNLAISDVGEIYAIGDDRCPWIRFRYTDASGKITWTRPVEVQSGQTGCVLA